MGLRRTREHDDARQGDARCRSIATASILAKVSRDRMMRAAAADHPGYDFEYNKATRAHVTNLPCSYGPTAIHPPAQLGAACDDLPWPGQRYASRPAALLFG
ncbi:MAG: hypothetical protein IPF42_11285 [Candidatus Microthrix sp.]|nr:hypothetical protein [Candidatus Microthrix sp.]